MARLELTAPADDVAALFERHGRATFRRVMEATRSSPDADGGGRWVSRLPDGRVVVHVAVHARRFSNGGRNLVAGVLGDLLADEGHRDFWGPLRLFRRTVSDLRADGRMDFLYSDPGPNSLPIAKAGGFTPLGAMRRYVYLLHPVYRALRGGLGGPRGLEARLEDGVGDDVATFLGQTQRATGWFRAVRTLDLYRARCVRETAQPSRFCLVRRDGALVALALLEESEASALALTEILWDEHECALRHILASIIAALRGERLRKLTATALDGSAYGRALVRAGFSAREVLQDLYWLPLREGAAIPPIGEWHLTRLDGSTW